MEEKCGVLFSETHLHFFADVSYLKYLKIVFANEVSGAISREYGVVVPSLEIFQDLRKTPPTITNCWFGYPCFKLAKKLGLSANDVAIKVSEGINEQIAKEVL